VRSACRSSAHVTEGYRVMARMAEPNTVANCSFDNAISFVGSVCTPLVAVPLVVCVLACSVAADGGGGAVVDCVCSLLDQKLNPKKPPLRFDFADDDDEDGVCAY
jgi:hypothetical protein